MMSILFTLPALLSFAVFLPTDTVGEVSAEKTVLTEEKKPLRKVWCLQECIDYACQNNISVKSAQLDQQSAEVELKAAKASRIPSLSFGSSQGFTNGSKFNEGNGNFVTTSQYTGTYALSTGVTLYNGGRINNTVKQRKVLHEASRLLVEKARNDIELSVTASFLEVLYAIETLRADSAVLENSRAQLELAEVRYEAGSIRKSEYTRIKAQYETDHYSYVATESNLANRKLELKQLLEFGPDEELEVVVPEADRLVLRQEEPSVAEIYETALRNMPEIKASELRITASEYARKAARAQMIPSLSLNASVGTGYYTTSQFSFLNQMHNNLNENVNVGISIPIYQQRQAKSSIETAKINTRQAMLNLQSEQKQLLKEIEQAWQDTRSARLRYAAARRQYEAAEVSYALVQEEYGAGGKTFVDVLAEKATYLASVEELLKAKYQAALSMRLIDFYMNRPASF